MNLKCLNCDGTGKIIKLIDFNASSDESCEYCYGLGKIKNLEDTIIYRGVLTGSRGMGFSLENSDYDYAVTRNDFHFIMQFIKSTDVIAGANSGDHNILNNECSSKFRLNNKVYNLIAFKTRECLAIIENITKAVSLFPESINKHIRNRLFEDMCKTLITFKVRNIPEIDEDDISF